MYFVGEGKLHVLFLHHLDAIYSTSRFSKIFSYGQIDEASLLKKDHSLKNEIYLCYFLLIYLWYFTVAFYWLWVVSFLDTKLHALFVHFGN